MQADHYDVDFDKALIQLTDKIKTINTMRLPNYQIAAAEFAATIKYAKRNRKFILNLAKETKTKMRMYDFIRNVENDIPANQQIQKAREFDKTFKSVLDRIMKMAENMELCCARLDDQVAKDELMIVKKHHLKMIELAMQDRKILKSLYLQDQDDNSLLDLVSNYYYSRIN